MNAETAGRLFDEATAVYEELELAISSADRSEDFRREELHEQQEEVEV